MSYRRYVRLGFRQPRRFYPCSTTPSHATFSDSEAVLKIKIHRDVRQGNTSILLGLCTSVLMDENHTKYLLKHNCGIDDTGVKPVRQYTTLSSSNLHLLKKLQVRKRDSFAHTSLRSKDKQSNFAGRHCKRGNKNHKPNNNTTTYRLERVHGNAKGITLLPANVQKNYILVTH